MIILGHQEMTHLHLIGIDLMTLEKISILSEEMTLLPIKIKRPSFPT